MKHEAIYATQTARFMLDRLSTILRLRSLG
jgi:hypothetical protein